jgi:twitching motility protein PilT
MELQAFNQFLGAAVKAGASDIHFKAGVVPAIRVNGELRAIRVPALRPEDTAAIAGHVLTAARWRGDLDALQEVDTSYALEGVSRFRASVFRQKGCLATILRAIPYSVPTLDQLGLPAVVKKIAGEERGLVLVTGITGSGKTSTLAAIVDQINRSSRKHVVTIEDPIEFLHEDRSSRITQREVGPDTPSFSSALRAALRQDPDVVLVGEMRDLETIEIAIKAAETGHLVLSTAHTTDATRTIHRLVGAYPAEAQAGVRSRLAEALQAVVSQRLLARADGKGRALACEVLVTSLGIQECIRDADKTSGIKDLMEKGRDLYGTQSFDQHLTQLYNAKVITLETAKEAASNASDLERALSFE